MKRSSETVVPPPPAGPGLNTLYPARVTLPEPWDAAAPIQAAGEAGTLQVSVAPQVAASLRAIVARSAAQGGQVVLLLEQTSLIVAGVAYQEFVPRDALELLVSQDGEALQAAMEDRLEVQEWRTALLSLQFTPRPAAEGPGWVAAGPQGSEARLLGLDGGWPRYSQSVRFELWQGRALIHTVAFLRSCPLAG